MSKNDMDKVQMYYEAALAVSAEHRTDFLAEVCGQEPELFYKVEALLKANSGDTDPSNIQASKQANKAIPNQPPVHPGVLDLSQKQAGTLQAGSEFGHYKIIEQIGKGGMGIIYKAEDKRLQRHVALKFLPPSMDGDALIRQRFLAEARAASQLDHPNICIVHDFGETRQGQLYIAMPCYEGETLIKRISRGAIPQTEVIDIVIQIADGLACAHEHNIIHRDIKPTNIMLTPSGVKILDFGVAKVQDTSVTQTGMSVGTLAYMSPEQLRGDPIDTRTDIWALGVVLYELLAGKQAFPAKALADILNLVLNESNTIVESQADKLPMVLFHVLQKSMACDLQDRFTDMSAMLEALYEARHTLVQYDPSDYASRQHPVSTVSSVQNKNRPGAYKWDKAVLEKISDLLVPILGPIAPVVVKHKAKFASDVEELQQKLVEALPDQFSREKFNQQIKTQIATFTSPPIPRALKTDGSLSGVSLSATQLATIEEHLIAHLGPITQTLITRQAARANSLPQLIETLAQQIYNPDEKQTFLEKMNILFESTE